MAENINTEAQYNVMGENTLTGNRWHCVGPVSYGEAVELRAGWQRLESDYKIAYYLEEAE